MGNVSTAWTEWELCSAAALANAVPVVMVVEEFVDTRCFYTAKAAMLSAACHSAWYIGCASGR
jgi:hypothetical protein